MFKLTVSPEKAPDTPTYIEIDFAQGTPVAVITSYSIHYTKLYELFKI